MLTRGTLVFVEFFWGHIFYSIRTIPLYLVPSWARSNGSSPCQVSFHTQDGQSHHEGVSLPWSYIAVVELVVELMSHLVSVSLCAKYHLSCEACSIASNEEDNHCVPETFLLRSVSFPSTNSIGFWIYQDLPFELTQVPHETLEVIHWQRVMFGFVLFLYIWLLEVPWRGAIQVVGCYRLLERCVVGFWLHLFRRRESFLGCHCVVCERVHPLLRCFSRLAFHSEVKLQ